jgi:hypothetical protein
MRINKKPVPCKISQMAESQKFILALAVGQVLHNVGLAKEEVKKKKDRSGDTYSNGR